MHQPGDLNEKIMPAAQARAAAAACRRAGGRVVFTNGCFDIVHAGHVGLLQEARALGDLLIVGLNSDTSVRSIKGPQRPIVPQHQRAVVLAGLAAVDCVVLFDEPDPLALIREITPDVLVKGGDWAREQIIGREVVEGRGGQVCAIAFKYTASTTDIISTVLDVYGRPR